MGSERLDVTSRRVTSTHAWRGRRSRRYEISSSGEVEIWVRTIRSGVVVLAAAVCTPASLFFVCSRISGCCRFVPGLLWPGHPSGGVRLGLLGRPRNRFMRGFGFGVEWRWRWRPAILGRRDSSHRPSPSAGQRTRALSIGSGGVACGGAISGTLRRLLCKGHPPFFPLNTAPVVR